MILLLDTSTPICKLSLIDGSAKYDDQWDSGRGLALGLLSYLQKSLSEHGKTWTDISGIGVFEGPGSFTGLRIGITVVNTIADANGVPIVGARGDDWQDTAMSKLKGEINEKIVLPFYGSEAKITTPRK